MRNPFFRNIPFIKANASTYLSGLGYTMLGYEGSDADLIYGGFGWVQAVRLDRSELVFTIQLRKQGDSLKMIYDRIMNPEAAAQSVTKTV